MSQAKKSAKRRAPVDYRAAAAFFKVASDPTRLRILFTLRDAADEAISVKELAARVGVGQDGVSQQLMGLRKEGMVDFKRDGLHNRYFLLPPCLRLLGIVEGGAPVSR